MSIPAKDTIAAIRARWSAATPGPWMWKGNLSSKSIELMARRGWGAVVMTFRRWGFNGAQPAFVIDGLIYGASTGKDGATMLVAPEPWNAWDIRDIDHPDARLIAHSWADIRDLLAEIDALRLVATEQIALAQYADQDFDEEVGFMFKNEPRERTAGHREYAAELLEERLATARERLARG